MICPKCNNQYDIFNAAACEDENGKTLWICPDCEVPLNDSDADPVLSIREKIKQAITSTIGEDRPFMVVPDIAEEVTQKVMEVVGQNTQGACEYCGKPKKSPNYAHHICASVKKEVVVTVTGGVASAEEIPPGIIVKIRDYDVEGCDEDKLVQDKEGNRYIEQIYHSSSATFTEDDTSYIGDDDDGNPC